MMARSVYSLVTYPSRASTSELTATAGPDFTKSSGPFPLPSELEAFRIVWNRLGTVLNTCKHFQVCDNGSRKKRPVDHGHLSRAGVPNRSQRQVPTIRRARMGVGVGGHTPRLSRTDCRRVHLIKVCLRRMSSYHPQDQRERDIAPTNVRCCGTSKGSSFTKTISSLTAMADKTCTPWSVMGSKSVTMGMENVTGKFWYPTTRN
ncbi:hypothetical protein BJV78DRAFT_81484 [Lactifluus subvellereus]|nr:hypothetical protein BJV78DRAFT_81484 [Lactifluus subvellereus]